MAANVALKKELSVTQRLSEELGDSEHCTRKKVLEIHGVPENSYTCTEKVVLKLGEALNEPIRLEDIESGLS